MKKIKKIKLSALDLIHIAHLKVIKDDLPFRMAIRATLLNVEYTSETKSLMNAVVGMELTHHLLFSYLISKDFGDVSVEELSLLSIVLSNSLFSKKIDNELLLKFTIKKLREYGSEIDEKQIEEFVNKHSDLKTIIGEEIPKGSLEYLELRYNTPKWVIKMWQKQFGKALTYQILRANLHQQKNTVRVNTLSASKEEVMKRDEGLFSLTELDNVLYVNDKKRLRESLSYELYDIFPLSLGMKDALDDVSVDSMKPIAIFQGSPGEKLFLEVMMKVGRSVKMDLILQGEKDYHEIKNNINKYGLDKTKLYISSPKEVVTCISEPVSTFFVLPESSNLEQIRLSPDYLLHFKSSSLDEIIANQKLLLNLVIDLG